jgi:multiple antibiotic resistance protein
MDLNLEIMLPIFFTTLGPLKTIPVFYALTRHTSRRHRAVLAMRATIDATLVVAFVAVVASAMMRKWQVSPDAVGIAGGLILFVTALRAITGFSLAELPPPPPEDVSPPQPTWLGPPALSPLAVPTIVTPGGVVAILFFVERAGENSAVRMEVWLMLALMMLANLIGMVLASPIMRVTRLAVLQIVGWVFALLQAGLAVQAVLNALERLRIVP